MKVLKIFIVLFGIMTLIQTTINAQLQTTFDVTMNFPNGPYANATTVTVGPVLESHATITVNLTCTISRELVVKVYSSQLYSTTGTAPQILVSDTSGSPTMSYTTTLNFDSTFEPDDKVYVECGYKDNNGAYKKDSGCVVVIQP